MKRKSIFAAVVLGTLSFNAAAWQINNGWCRQLSDDGQVMLLIKAERVSVYGQKSCDESYFGKGETFGVNGDAYAALGTCNQQTGHNPISVADNAQSASAVAHAIASREQGVIQAFGGSMPFSRGNFIEVCSAVIPSLKTVGHVGANKAHDVNMDSVLAAAKAKYMGAYGADALDSADFDTVTETSPVVQGSESVRVFQYEVSNPPYRQYDYVVVFVNAAGKVVDTQIEHQGR